MNLCRIRILCYLFLFSIKFNLGISNLSYIFLFFIAMNSEINKYNHIYIYINTIEIFFLYYSLSSDIF